MAVDRNSAGILAFVLARLVQVQVQNATTRYAVLQPQKTIRRNNYDLRQIQNTGTLE